MNDLNSIIALSTLPGTAALAVNIWLVMTVLELRAAMKVHATQQARLYNRVNFLLGSLRQEPVDGGGE